MKLSPRQRQGQQGEDAALAFLEQRGLKLITRNYRCRLGELDLVMHDGENVVIVEVRQRRHNRFGGPLASVGANKQQRLVQAARHLLMTRPRLAELPLRFDVVGIEADGDPDWIQNAFTAF